MILSNWHILAASEYAFKGLRIFQPGYGDNGNFSNTVATLERHAFNDGIDAAVARLTGVRGWVNDQMEIGPVTGSATPALDMQVIKSGRTSGVTYGVIDGLEGEYPIYYGGTWHTIKHVHRIVPQVGKSEVSRPGDSGSWWLEQPTGKAVALHFAGQNDPETALGIAMPQVLEALNVEIVPSEQPVFGQPETARLLERIPG
jgi:endonuclease G